MSVKKVASSQINQAALLIGGIAAYKTCKTIFFGDGNVELTPEDAMNIMTFVGAVVVFIKRTWAENAPIMFKKKD